MNKLIYTKYSTDRCPAFAIRTDRLLDDDGNQLICKHALYDQGRTHLEHMVKMCDALKSRYESRSVPAYQNDTNGPSPRITISSSSLQDGVLFNEFVTGSSYYDKYVDLIAEADVQGLKDEIAHFTKTVNYSEAGTEPFVNTAEFEEVFGHFESIEGYGFVSALVTDIDMVFENIIVADDGTWQLIDYEWTFDFPIPSAFVIYRALVFLYQKLNVENVLSWNDCLAFAGITYEHEMIFRAMEEHLNEYITGGVTTLEQAVVTGDTRIIPRADLLARFDLYDEAVHYKDDLDNLKEQHEALERANKALNGELQLSEERHKAYMKIADKNSVAYNQMKDAFVKTQAELNTYRTKERNSLGRKIKNKLRK